jgi:hypothetical protein
VVVTPALALFGLACLLFAFVAGAVWEGTRSGGTLDQHLKLAHALRDEERT